MTFYLNFIFFCVFLVLAWYLCLVCVIIHGTDQKLWSPALATVLLSVLHDSLQAVFYLGLLPYNCQITHSNIVLTCHDPTQAHNHMVVKRWLASASHHKKEDLQNCSNITKNTQRQKMMQCLCLRQRALSFDEAFFCPFTIQVQEKGRAHPKKIIRE